MDSERIKIKRHLTIQPREEVQIQPLSIAATKEQPMTSFHLGEEVIGGFAAGVIGTLLGFPLDLVKTRYVCAYVMLCHLCSVHKYVMCDVYYVLYLIILS